MREIDFSQITENDMISHEILSGAFKKYLMDVIGYDEEEASFVAETDFSEPYDAPYISAEYEGEYDIGSKTYEILSCKTDFCSIGMWQMAENPPFEFCMLIDIETKPDNTIGSYQKASKMYIL